MSIGWTLGPADVLWILVVVLPILVGLGSYAVTIAALASAARQSDEAWRQAESGRLFWVVLLAVGMIMIPFGLVFAIVYLLGPGRRFRRAARRPAPPAPLPGVPALLMG
jgi:uncharacterized BrkB/YihY/UPF0761 family membrane protein